MSDDPPYSPNAYKVTTFFPLFGNDGSPFPEEVWNWWRDAMTGFKGYTDMGVVLGTWEK
jgi:hypothetical protein